MPSHRRLIGISGAVRPRLVIVVLALADVAALVSSLLISLLLRFDNLPFDFIYKRHLKDHVVSFPVCVALYIVIFFLFRLYRYAWRFASLEMLWGVICTNTVGLMGLIVIQSLVDGGTFPRSVLVIFWTVSIITVGGTRVMLRLASILRKEYSRRRLRGESSGAPARRVIILGGGSHGAGIMRTLSQDPDLHYQVIGFLDDDPLKSGAYIGSVQVLGPIRLLGKLLARGEVDEVIVAIPHAADIRQQVLECRESNVPVKVVPELRDVLNGRTYVKLEDFSVEDLLRRPLVKTNVEEIGHYLAGKRVLVTGAGGGIGSELCRQIMSFGPASLLLVGHGENSIFQIRRELQRSFPELADRIYWVIASVSNQFRVNQVFDCFGPEVVFHAAAHKHVPIMESNMVEAVHNNVLGTSYVADACGCVGVERMVLISTDKAASPTSVMGATKWLCEEVVRASASTWPGTTYVTVRFGNVLGSPGSVVPLFREQIARGGPVTVTHPEMTRYFMTIREAVQLVLQAGAIGRSGELYLLDMGQPVRILDLARDMIRLCGREPDVDVPIIFSGIRPGERLHEQLISEDEEIEDAACEGMSIAHRREYFSPSEVLDLLQRFKEIINYGDEAQMLKLLGEVIPGFAARREFKLLSPGSERLTSDGGHSQSYTARRR
ncbi:MAG: polysaccharide biosynthesis protein [Armatimonadetes bacterium]|nr:polysaccharide biosynthesis protein [Armatimonadota bacterium]